MDPAAQKATKAEDAQKREAARRAKREVKILKRNDAFTEHSLQKALERVRTDRNNAEVVGWARLEMARAGHPLRKRARAAALLKAWRDQFGYTEDPVDGEFIAKAQDVMCLPGHDYCLMGGDCEECFASLAAAMSAVGLTVAAIVVRYRPGTPKEQRHIFGAVQVEKENGDGLEWVRFDNSYFDTLGQAITVDKNGKLIPKQERWIDVMTGAELHRGDGTTTPSKGVSQEVFRAARPNLEYVGINGVSLGDGVTDQEAGPVFQAFGDYLKAGDAAMMAAFARAKSSIAALQDARDVLKLPQYDPDGSSGWTAQLASSFYDKLTQAVTDLHKYATEALSQKRDVAWVDDNAGSGAVVIGQNPGDQRAYSLGPADTLMIEDIGAGNPGLGIAPLLVVAVVAGVVVGSVAVYLTVAKLCETYQAHAAAVAQADTAKAFADAKKNGATPAEIQAMADAIKKSAAAANPPNPSASNDLLSFGKTVVTGIAVVAVAGAALVIADRLFQVYEERKKLAAA